MDRIVSQKDDCAALLQRVVASRTFSRSPRLAKFLETVCMLALDGRSQEISEQQIGVAVFGRSPMYSAADDSIVRTQARLLRQKLEEYFDGEDAHSSLVITIPRGGYVPLFEPRRQPSESFLAPVETPVQAPASSAVRPNRQLRLVLPVLAALVLIGVGAAVLSRSLLRPVDPLWTPFFSSGRPVLIVPSDDALVLLQEATHTSITLADYRNGSWLEQPKVTELAGSQVGPRWFASHQYTSTADLNLALRLGRLPFANQAVVESRNARDLRLDDLKQNNVVLIGGSGANPWVDVFAERLNFSVHWDWQNSRGEVLNRHPAPGESSTYEDDPSVSAPKSYGILALLPGMDGNGQVLLFEGTGMAGTESAADLPFSGERFTQLMHSLGATRDHLPYFEVLLETSSLAGNAPEARIVAFRKIPISPADEHR